MILFPGLSGSSFQSAGPPVWSTGDFGLDNLTIPMTGKITDLDAYRNSLNKWSGRTDYPGMYLSRWSNDDDKHFPTVSLVYIGCKGNNYLNRSRTEQDSRLQTAVLNFQTSEASLQIDLQYQAGIAVTSGIYPSDATFPLAPTPNQAPTKEFARVLLRNYGISGDVMGFFTPRATISKHSEPLVPGRWYLNSVVAGVTLDPVL